jgi:hypothetical protein
LRFGPIVLDDKLRFAVCDAAFAIERGDRHFDAVAPSAIDGRGVAGQASRHADLEDVLGPRGMQ